VAHAVEQPTLSRRLRESVSIYKKTGRSVRKRRRMRCSQLPPFSDVTDVTASTVGWRGTHYSAGHHIGRSCSAVTKTTSVGDAVTSTWLIAASVASHQDGLVRAIRLRVGTREVLDDDSLTGMDGNPPGLSPAHGTKQPRKR
jgi:hypothetical protein